jgi:hypothetical protein
MKFIVPFKWNVIILFIITGILVGSCKRGVANFTLSGTISDDTFSTPLTGATLKLYKVPITSGDEILIDTKILEADGKYEFTFPREKIEKYIIRVSKNLYFDIDEDIQFSSLIPSAVNTRNFSTKAKSWVELRFVNTSVQTSDHFRFIKLDGKENCAECCSADQVDLYSTAYYSRTCINDALTPYSIYYQVIGTTNSNLIEVVTQPFDTTLLLVNY